MYRKILIPLDGSAFAESAIPPALSLAERSGGEVHLVTVLPPPASFDLDLESDGVLRSWLAERVTRTEAYLEELRGRIAGTGTSAAVHTHVLSGHPVRALHEWILDESVDQVVMTSHGRGGLRRLWLGSVADGLVRRAPSPVLLWRPDRETVDLAERPSIQKILVPLDGSQLAEAIVYWARELARLFEARISLVGVVDGPLPFSSPHLGQVAAEEAERVAEATKLEEYLARVAGRIRKRGLQVDTAVISGPSPAERILERQAAIGADVVALSTHGRGGITRAMLGSVADKVIRGTEGHVLVHLDSEEQ